MFPERIYARRAGKWHQPGITLALVIILFLIGGFLSRVIFPTAIIIAQPIWQANNWLASGLTSSLSFFESKRKLLEDNNRLRETNAQISLELLVKQGVEKDRDELRRLLGQLPSKNMPLVAGVILEPNEMPYNTMIIDLGADNAKGKISPNDLVVVNGVLLGQVTQIGSDWSKVKLFSASGQEISVTIGTGNIPAVARGVGSGNFSIILPKGTLIKQGDKIIASAYDNYVLGVAEVIKKSTADPFQTILFATPINLFQLKWVEIYARQT